MDPIFAEEILTARSLRYLELGRSKNEALDMALADFLNDAEQRLPSSDFFFFRAMLANASRALYTPVNPDELGL
jgi:hypothetical protein